MCSPILSYVWITYSGANGPFRGGSTVCSDCWSRNWVSLIGQAGETARRNNPAPCWCVRSTVTSRINVCDTNVDIDWDSPCWEAWRIQGHSKAHRDPRFSSKREYETDPEFDARSFGIRLMHEIVGSRDVAGHQAVWIAMDRRSSASNWERVLVDGDVYAVISVCFWLADCSEIILPPRDLSAAKLHHVESLLAHHNDRLWPTRSCRRRYYQRVDVLTIHLRPSVI